MKPINVNLSVSGCWKMVNRIQLGRTRAEILERCKIAEKWLRENKVLTNEQWNDLMRAVTQLYREAYKMEG